MIVFETREEAQRAADRDHQYYVRCLRGQWVVWDEASDHVVQFEAGKTVQS